MLSNGVPALVAASIVMFAVAPVLIGLAPYESTMGLVQKIFYYHVPVAIMSLVSTVVCGVSSAQFLFGGSWRADRRALAAAELAVVYGLIMLLTGPLWGRKAWGVYWQWDARLTSALVVWMIMVSYLMLRRFGGPGSEKLAAALALFGMVNVPFVYWSVNVWRTVHPRTTVLMTLDSRMQVPFLWSMAAFVVLYLALFAVRLRLEEQRARLDVMHMALEEA